VKQGKKALFYNKKIMLSYKHIRTDRQWKSSTGLSQDQFEKLLGSFKETYAFFQGVSLEESAQRRDVDLLLATYADCLFFVLFQLKNGLCYDNLGLLIGTDGSNAQRNFEKYLQILTYTLDRQGVMPKRNFANLAEFKACLQDEKEIIIDASEQPTARPKDQGQQKEQYSGKKRDIPIKNL
jgi:hypothetical protein